MQKSSRNGFVVGSYRLPSFQSLHF